MKILFNVYLILFLMTTCLTQMQKRKRNFEIIIMKVHCDILTPKITSLECFLSYTKHISAINVKLLLNQDLPNITAHITCTLMRKNQRNYNIVDTVLNVCQFLAFNVKGGLLQMFAKQFKTVGVNLEDGCPLKKNIWYGIKELKAVLSFFPPFSPDLNYTIRADIYNFAERFATFESLGSIFQKKKTTKA